MSEKDEAGRMYVKKYGSIRIELDERVCSTMQRTYAYRHLGFTPKTI
jgi:hypothetical protein